MARHHEPLPRLGAVLPARPRVTPRPAAARAAADAATSKNGKVPDAGNLRKKMYKQKRNFLFCPFTQPSLMRPVYYLKSNENMGSR